MLVILNFGLEMLICVLDVTQQNIWPQKFSLLLLHVCCMYVVYHQINIFSVLRDKNKVYLYLDLLLGCCLTSQLRLFHSHRYNFAIHITVLNFVPLLSSDGPLSCYAHRHTEPRFLCHLDDPWLSFLGRRCLKPRPSATEAIIPLRSLLISRIYLWIDERCEVVQM